MANFTAVIFAIIVSIFALISAAILYYYIWIKGRFVEIPLQDEDNQDDKKNTKHAKSIKTFNELIRTFLPLWQQLESKYWIYNIGLDGYSYIYFQREIMKMFFLNALITICIGMPIRYWISNFQDDNVENTDIYNHKEAIAILDCVLIYFYTMYTLLVIYKVKRHIRAQKIIQNSKSKNPELESLKLRSLHMVGLYPEDRRGEILKMEIEGFLEFSGGGKMLSMIVLPDFTEIITKENERKVIDNAQKLYLANEPAVRRLLYPKRFREEQYFEKELQKIDNQIEEVAMKPIMSSGHAFVCLDSISAKNKCLKHFKLDTKGVWSIMTDQIKEKVAGIRSGALLKRERMTSTFGKFNDEEALNKLKQKEIQLIAQNLYDSVDIFWSNMGGTRGLFFFRRLLINITAILILLFLTTPTAAFRALEQIDYFNIVGSIKSLNDHNILGHIVKEYLPPMVILCLNQLLILLIDYAAYMEKHSTYSLYQLSIFGKSTFYLMLNMLIIPGLTMATADSLFKLLFGEGDNLTQAIKNFYFSDSGNFYVIVMIQSGALAASSRLIRLGEIINSFGSSWLAHYKRTYLNDSERWRRGERDIFAYGFNFAHVVCMFTIIMTYSATTPSVIIAGLVYFFLKNLIDSYHLLVVHKKEIESSGQLINTILKYTLGGCCIFQFAISCSFIFNGFITSFTLTSLLFLITFTLMLTFSDEREYIGEKENIDLNVSLTEGFSKEDVKNWEKYYSHPLLVSNTELFIQREDRSRSYRLTMQ